MIIIFLIISFLLDGIIFSLTSINGVVEPLFSLLALIILYPYYCCDKRKMYICATVVGILYDIVYTNTLFLNTIVFVGIMYLVDRIYKVLTNNFFNTFIVSTIIICLYRVVIYIFFFILGVVDLEPADIISSVSHSLFINYIYITIFYFTLYGIAKKLQIKRRV